MTAKPDTDIDTSDIPEARHAGRGVRGKYYEQATGRPLPQAVRLLNKAEAEVRALREALEAARPYVEGSVDYPEHSRDGVLEQIDDALARAR